MYKKNLNSAGPNLANQKRENKQFNVFQYTILQFYIVINIDPLSHSSLFGK